MRIRIAGLLFIFCFSALSLAQVPRGVPRPSGATKMTLTIRVRLPNDQPISTAAQVQLLSGMGSAITETFTNADGRVEFNDISPGIYRIKVSGADIETTTSDAFDIGDNDRTHSEIVRVKPIPRAGSSAPRGRPTISSQQLNIPEKARNELEKGMDAFSKGDSKKAAAKMERAIEIFPRYAEAYNNLGVIRIKQGDKAAAKAAFEKAVQIDDHLAPGYVNLARLLVSNRESEAIAMLQKALTIDSDNLEGLAFQARVQFNKGEFKDALATINKIHGMPHEHFADVHLIAAEIYQKENRNAEAVAESESYLKEYPDSPRAPQVRQAMAQIKSRI
jgi:Tfp pilus assembly protein PilF